jgi:hypothetical protein
MRKIMFLLVILVTMTGLLIGIESPCWGDELGIHGEVNFTYELAPYNPGQVWSIDLYYNFNSWLSVGSKQTTFTNGFYELGFIPTNQLYENYLRINIDENIYFKVCQWCNHPVYSGIEFNKDMPHGLYIEGNYKF